MSTQTGNKRRTPILIGGNLALDFVNSLYWRNTKTPIEWFNNYEDLVTWGLSLSIISEAQAKRTLRQARSNPKRASAVVAQAIKLREAIYQIFKFIIKEKNPARADLNLLNQILSKSLAHLKILQSTDGFDWQWNSDDSALDAMLWPIARSAAELLAEGDWMRVGQCAGEGCGWLFLDVSKNHSRRWCAMEHCGHKTNARLHYHRKRKQANDVNIF